MTRTVPPNGREIAVLLHNIRSAHNVGAIFRTSDAIGVTRMFLSGYTPIPLDRFGRAVKEIAKTALGAEQSIPWEYAKQPGLFIRRLKQEGYAIVGVEQDPRAIDYRSYQRGEKTLVVMGNEVRGISHGLRKHCDTLIEIPMYGKKESLNVAVSFGIAVFRICEQ